MAANRPRIRLDEPTANELYRVVNEEIVRLLEEKWRVASEVGRESYQFSDVNDRVRRFEALERQIEFVLSGQGWGDYAVIGVAGPRPHSAAAW